MKYFLIFPQRHFLTISFFNISFVRLDCFLVLTIKEMIHILFYFCNIDADHYVNNQFSFVQKKRRKWMQSCMAIAFVKFSLHLKDIFYFVLSGIKESIILCASNSFSCFLSIASARKASGSTSILFLFCSFHLTHLGRFTLCEISGKNI